MKIAQSFPQIFGIQEFYYFLNLVLIKIGLNILMKITVCYPIQWISIDFLDDFILLQRTIRFNQIIISRFCKKKKIDFWESLKFSWGHVKCRFGKPWIVTIFSSFRRVPWGRKNLNFSWKCLWMTSILFNAIKNFMLAKWLEF